MNGEKKTLQTSLFDYFKDDTSFTIKEAEETALNILNFNVKLDSVRARIYEGIDKGFFIRLGRGVYQANNKDSTCILINGNGRDLSMLKDNSVDSIITDHPYDLVTNKGGNRNFADYHCFQYNENDFKEKLRVLKKGSFLVEFLPEESGSNWEYLNYIKTIANKVGFEYYAKVSWIKGNQVNNTGRKSSNTEDLLFFSKGKARHLRLDTKKNKKELELAGIQTNNKSSEEIKNILNENNLQVHYMSGTNGMLPTAFYFSPPNKNVRINQSEKPMELIQEVIKYITEEFELVVDQFAGSGVTGKAALKEKRDSIIIELDSVMLDKVISSFKRDGISLNKISMSRTKTKLKDNDLSI